jgi:hypothetical protein
MRNGFKRLLTVFIALLFVGCGVALLCLATQTLTKAKDSAGWSSTDGIVMHTDHERTSRGRRTSNAPYVTYTYQVQGKGYTSNVRSFGDGLSEPEVFEQYPMGRHVTVFYDPEHPQEATLVKGVGTGTIAGVRYAQVILGLALAFLTYVTITEVKKRRNSQQVGSSNGG